jgi:precorrin-6A synthase
VAVSRSGHTLQGSNFGPVATLERHYRAGDGDIGRERVDMRSILVIGIGAGDPSQLTVQAVRALNRVDVFFVIDKGAVKDDLVQLRYQICAEHITNDSHRFVEVAEPDRDRDPPDYAGAVADWHTARARMLGVAIRDELAPGQVGAFLVWGDPALYDSTLRVLDRITELAVEDGRPAEFDVEVIPGISSVQALAARHRLPLNRIGEPILITTGRRLREFGPALPEGTDNVVVMLDSELSFTRLDPAGVSIYWGAYLGTPDELLIAGPLGEVADQIVEVRAAARRRKGWIMDTYLLRR